MLCRSGFPADIQHTVCVLSDRRNGFKFMLQGDSIRRTVLRQCKQRRRQRQFGYGIKQITAYKQCFRLPIVERERVCNKFGSGKGQRRGKGRIADDAFFDMNLSENKFILAVKTGN